MTRGLFLTIVAAITGQLFAQAPAHAEFPEKAVRLVVPYPPGAFNDSMSRTLARHLSEKWRQPVLVENRPGGGTILATELVAKSRGDGHTLLVASFAFSINPALHEKLPYNSEKDFAPVILTTTASNVMVVHSESRFRSLGDLIAGARAGPGTINYGSAGNGSSTHLCMELLRNRIGLDLVHVAYKGSAPAIAGLLGRQVDVTCDNAPNVLPHVRGGRLRAIASTGTQRVGLLPDVPTVAESGIPGFELLVWFGVLAPSTTPPAIIQKINADIQQVLALPAVREGFAAQGVETRDGSPEDFSRFIRAQAAKWIRFIKEAGIKPE